MGKLFEKLAKKRILLCDGAWGTFLFEKGLQAGDCPEYWNILRPGDVRAIANAYLDAGSDIIETNSFGANSIKLSHFNLGSQAAKINLEAAKISRLAAGESRIVLGSVGPTGKLLMMGDVTEEAMYDSFAEQCKALEEGGADALIIETMSDIEEARIALKAAQENTHCDIIVSFTYLRKDSGYHTMMGYTPLDVINAFSTDSRIIIGSNCGNGIKDMIPVAELISREKPSAIIMIQANAGNPQYKDGKTVFPESPEEMVESLPQLIQAGVRILGGCCGTSPAHIRAFRKYIESI